MSKPGRMKMIADKVPAADACVCTMLFSKMLESLNMRRIAMEMTAAGMDEENVRPTFKPKYTLDAVKITVIKAPRIIPRAVNSGILG